MLQDLYAMDISFQIWPFNSSNKLKRILILFVHAIVLSALKEDV